MNVMWRQVKQERRPKKKNAVVPDFNQSPIKAALPSLTLTQCVEELVLIAIDSSPDCISIRVNIGEAFVQVVDNGKGINESTIRRVGECKPLTQLSANGEEEPRKIKSPWYGPGSEVVLAMVEVSEKVEVISRSKKATDGVTFSKTFLDGLGTIEKVTDGRPCAGTTATIHNLFHKTPVRRKQLNESKELNEVLLLVQGLAVTLAGKISMSLRDEAKGKVLLNTSKLKTVKEAVLGVFGPGYCSSLHTLKGVCGDIQIAAVLSTEAYTGRKAKIISLNYKRISNRRIEQAIDTQLKTSKIAVATHDKREVTDGKAKTVSKPKHYFYCIDIRCDRSMYNAFNQDGKTSVEFHNWQATLNSIYKIIKKFLILHQVYRPDGIESKRGKKTPDSWEHKTVSSKSTDGEKASVTAVNALKAHKSVSREAEHASSLDCVPTREFLDCAPTKEKVDCTPAMELFDCVPTKEKVDCLPTRELLDCAPTRGKAKCVAPSKPPAGGNPWPHVVYWLLKLVPDHVPRLDPLPSDEVVAPSNMSMYPHPGSVHHGSRLSDSLGSDSLPHKSAGSGTVPHKRRKINTSFNQGDSSHSVFGSKLKMYESDYDTENHYRPPVHSPAAKPALDSPPHRHRERIIPESAVVCLERRQQRRMNRDNRLQHGNKRVASHPRPDEEVLLDFPVINPPHTPVRNSPRLVSHHSLDFFAPPKARELPRRHSRPVITNASPDVFHDFSHTDCRSPLQASLPKKRYFTVAERGSHQHGTSAKKFSDVTFHGDAVGAAEHVDIFCDVDSNSSSASVMSGIPAVDRIFNETRSKQDWSFDSADRRVSQRQSQRLSQGLSQRQSQRQSEHQSSRHSHRHVSAGVDRREGQLYTAFSPPHFSAEFEDSPVRPVDRDFDLLRDNPAPDYQDSNRDEPFARIFRSPYIVEQVTSSHFLQPVLTATNSTAALLVPLSNATSCITNSSSLSSSHVALVDTSLPSPPPGAVQQKDIPICDSKHSELVVTSSDATAELLDGSSSFVGSVPESAHMNPSPIVCSNTAHTEPAGVVCSMALSESVRQHGDETGFVVQQLADSAVPHESPKISQYSFVDNDSSSPDLVGKKALETLMNTDSASCIASSKITVISVTKGNIIPNTKVCSTVLSSSSVESKKNFNCSADVHLETSPHAALELAVTDDIVDCSFNLVVTDELNCVKKCRSPGAPLSPEQPASDDVNKVVEDNMSISSGWSEIAHNINQSRKGLPQDVSSASDCGQNVSMEEVQHNQLNASQQLCPPVVAQVTSSEAIVSPCVCATIAADLKQASTPHGVEMQESTGAAFIPGAASNSPSAVVVDQAQAIESKSATALANSIVSLMSSFTSEELNFLNDELQHLRPTSDCTLRDASQPPLYVDCLSGNTFYHLDVQQTNTSTELNTPLRNPTFSFQCGKTPYTTPRSFPNLHSVVSQQGRDDFIPFNKELLTPLSNKKPIVLTADLLVKPSVIGQWGKQIILLICKVSSPGEEVILAVDQHAAHERIRVELLASKYIDKNGQVLPSALSTPYKMSLSREIVEFLSQPESIQLLAKHGIGIKLLDNSIVSVTSVPLAVSLYCTEQGDYIKTFVESVAIELMERGSTTILISKCLQDVINSQACRGAIKFGDELTRDQCVAVISRLSRCKLPFQCAHGRPSTVPLYNMSSLTNLSLQRQTRAPRLSKLKLKQKSLT